VRSICGWSIQMSKSFAICRHIMVLEIDIYCGTREYKQDRGQIITTSNIENLDIFEVNTTGYRDTSCSHHFLRLRGFSELIKTISKKNIGRTYFLCLAFIPTPRIYFFQRIDTLAHLLQCLLYII